MVKPTPFHNVALQAPFRNPSEFFDEQFNIALQEWFLVFESLITESMADSLPLTGVRHVVCSHDSGRISVYVRAIELSRLDEG